ncbi:hypothetical protein IAR55_003833 [Kwoniella newhampshirensis]|uniref:Cbb3-type cytochrome c oxidase subunit CcoP N-terminal domain-containing protein n=1 Tax=Kwoniella newhampshirensis TaxID=1651941 RepID=A0AAW0YYC6_9TREE
MSAYQPIPTSSPPPGSAQADSFPPAPRPDSPSDTDQSAPRGDPSYRPLRSAIRAEFNRPPPPWWKRLLLIFALIGMGWMSVYLGKKGLGGGGTGKKEVIYASRYSDEFKYRPAASPVITEYLPDGRTRIRGASIGSHGVREEDIPLSPAQIVAREKKRREDAREKARERMGLKKSSKKGKKKGKGTGTDLKRDV